MEFEDNFVISPSSAVPTQLSNLEQDEEQQADEEEEDEEEDEDKDTHSQSSSFVDRTNIRTQLQLAVQREAKALRRASRWTATNKSWDEGDNDSEASGATTTSASSSCSSSSNELARHLQQRSLALQRLIMKV